MSDTEFRAWYAEHRSVIARLHAASGGTAWDVSEEALASALFESACRLPGGLDSAETPRYLQSLHVADLALACACRNGHEAAWEHFVREYRPALYAAARAIAGDEGRDLADALYAELFGVSRTGAERRPLLSWFHGRSRLTTWLRSVLVQRHIDRRRAGARLDSLDSERVDETVQIGGAPLASPDPDRQRYIALAQEALDRAIAALDARSRLRLRLYYGQELTLAQIGRVTGEHEATVSRKLERSRRDLRRELERHLRDRGLSDDQVRDCVEHAAAAPELHVTRLLSRVEDG
jgi:RNA polymerase sigma-70 factor (ECF subfamily)